MRLTARSPLLLRLLPAIAALIALTALVALLAGAGTAQADRGHGGAAGHVHFEDLGSGCETCPDAPSGWAEPGPGHGEITVHWTPATTGPAAASWRIFYFIEGEDLKSADFSAGARRNTFTGFVPGGTYQITVVGRNTAGAAGGRARADVIAFQDAAPPAFLWAKAEGTTLTVTFDEDLDTASAPAGSAFQVSIAAPGATARTINGTGTAVLSGKTATVTLASVGDVHAYNEKVTVSYTRPSSGPLRDGLGNNVASFSNRKLAEHANLGHAHFMADDSLPAGCGTCPHRPNGHAAPGFVEGEITVRWTKATTGLTPQRWIIAYRKSGTTSITQADPNISAGTQEYTLSGLEPGVKYDVIIAGAKSGTGANLVGDRAVAASVAAGISEPKFSGATVNGNVMTLTFDKQLNEDQAPPESAFKVSVHHDFGEVIPGCAGVCFVPVAGVSISGAELTLTLAQTIPAYTRTQVQYRRPASSAPLIGEAIGYPVGPFHAHVTVLTPDTTPPSLSSAALQQGAEGASLLLYFTEALDEDQAPPESAFRVTATPPGGSARAIAVTEMSYINARWLKLVTGPAPGGQDARVTVSYVRPSAGGLRDLAGHLMESFSNRPVTNGPPVIESVNLVSDPGPDRTYGLGEQVRVQVTFDIAVSVNATGGRPRLKLDLTPESGGRRWADYESGDDTETLTFAYTVAESDLSTAGIAVLTNPIDLNGSRIGSFHPWPQETADLSYSRVPHDPAHRVDAMLPVFHSASVDGETLTLTFAADLDADSVPAPGAFHVTVNNARRNVASGGVAVSGKTVALTLASAVAHTDTVKVRYTRPSANPLQSPGGTAMDTFADQEVANDTQFGIWSATLTVDRDNDGDGLFGCSDVSADYIDDCATRLTDHAFSRGNTSYEVTSIWWVDEVEGDNRPERLELFLDEAIPRHWILHVGDRQFPIEESIRNDLGTGFEWQTPGLTWTEHEQVSVRLTAPPLPAPVFQSAEVEGTTLTVTFTETLDADSVPAPGDFHVTVNGSRRNVASGGVAVSGKTVTLTLASAVTHLDTVRVRYTRPSANPLQRLFGRAVETLADQDVAHGGASGLIAQRQEQVPALSVTGVSVVSDPGADQTYGIGDTIQVRVTFNQLVVDVDTSGGTPRLKIDMDPAEWGEKWASYASGSGTPNLIFTHTVVEPNISTQGIAVLESTLELNGGTIRSGGEDAALVHAGLAHDAGHKVDWQKSSDGGDSGASGGSGASGDSGSGGSGASGRSSGANEQQSAPASVSGVSVSSTPQANATYRAGETIRITLTFSEAVDVTGTPRLKIDMDPAEWGEKWASYASGSGTANLIFTHTVVEPNISTQGIAVLTDTLDLNGGDIESSASDTDADLSHTGLAHDANHKVDWQPPTPTVTGVSVTSGPGGDDTYGLNDVIRISVTFSEAVDVAGTPRLTIDMDPADWGEKWAEYEGGSGATTLTFTHTVVEPNYSTQGIAVLANSLALNGGDIESSATDTDADLAHTGLAHDTNHKVDWQQSDDGGPGS